jgi:hypothetical protein
MGTYRAVPRFIVLNACSAGTGSTARLYRESERLAAERARFSLAHELAHHVLGQLEDDQVDTSGPGDSIALLEQTAALLGIGEPVFYLEPATPSPGTFELPQTWPLTNSDLPAWQTGALSKFGLSDWSAADSRTPSRPEPAMRVRIAGAATVLLASARTAYLRYLAQLLADIAATAIRQIGDTQSVIYAALSLRMAVLARKPGPRAFVLVILATCRRYGRRSEPGDHAVLPVCRHLMSRGVAART